MMRVAGLGLARPLRAARALPRPAAAVRPRHPPVATSVAAPLRRALASSAGQPLLARYAERTASGLCRHSEAQVPCLDRLQKLLSDLKTGSPQQAPRGIYIYGDPGAGKTMMMDMFHELVQESGLRSRRAHFHDFMLDMNRDLHRIRQQVGGVKDPLALVAQDFVKQSPLLCFDECHVLNVGDALLMRSFFERLFEAGGTVVATSNLAPDELYSSGINREVFQPFIDAIMKHCDPVRLTVGEDFRSSKSAELAAMSGERTFFWPLGAAAEKKLGDTLALVIGDDSSPQAGEIEVPMGRKLPCRRMWVDGKVKAAEFSYEELCVRPVGTYDYIALCENFDVIVLTGVPRFCSTDENAARRFASLVDVLYDRHLRLLCTVDAPPRELFAAIREQYSGGVDDDADLRAAIRMPTFGGSSGKHVAQFRIPQVVSYTSSGGYSVSSSSSAEAGAEGARGAEGAEGAAAAAKSDPDGGWVEWSATGLKDASMFDLTCHTKTQQHDRLLPLIRCESRLEEMSYLHGQPP